jgi:hypothetical protein
LDRKDIGYVYVYAAFDGLIALSLPLGVQAVIGLIAGGAVSASLILLVGVVTVATALSGLLRIMQTAPIWCRPGTRYGGSSTVSHQIFTKPIKRKKKSSARRRRSC